MKTTKEYKDYILEQLAFLGNVTCRPMMGEYLLYHDGILFGGIYNNRLLVKIVAHNQKYQMPEAIPYPGAKAMYLVEAVDQRELLAEIVSETCKDLPLKKTGNKKRIKQ